MAILTQPRGGNLVEIEMSGKLHREDYEHFMIEFDRLVKTLGKLRVLIVMKNFEGWDISAAWEDMKFGAKHYSSMERIAIVGDKMWEMIMAKFWSPFTKAKVHYFDKDHVTQAQQWLEAKA
jgi:hypothetical protein